MDIQGTDRGSLKLGAKRKSKMALKPISIVKILQTWLRLRIVGSQWNKLFVNSHIETIPPRKSWYTRIGLMWPKSLSTKKLQPCLRGYRLSTMVKEKWRGINVHVQALIVENCNRKYDGCGAGEICMGQFPCHLRERVRKLLIQTSVKVRLFFTFSLALQFFFFVTHQLFRKYIDIWGCRL